MPTKSTYPDIDIPNVDIWGLLFDRKDREFSDDQVIYRDPDTGRSHTYIQVKEIAINFGKGLKAVWDWQKGDVVGLFTQNSIDVPPVIWGIHWAGGIPSPANPGYTAAELAFQLKDSGAKALVTQKQCLKQACEAARMVGIPKDRIILLGDERDQEMGFKHFTAIRNIATTIRYRRTKSNPIKDLAFLVYSSGTTGHPKGVMLSHSNIVSNILMLNAGEDGNLHWRNDRLLSFLPFFHIYGLTCVVHQALYTGVELIVMSKFDFGKFCSHVQEFRCTFAYVVPPIILMLSKSDIVDKYDLSSIRMMNSGAAPLSKELVDTVYTRLKIPIKQGYGLSETSPTTHVQPWDRWQSTCGSVGALLPNQVAKYMTPEGKEVPAGETGELWIKGPNIFIGYLNNPEGTKNALTEDGFFKTGDVGHQDENGNFYITDRVKELIKYKGFQVPPAELEGILSTHPEIDDVAVIGIYIEEQATEVPRAYVVLKKGVADLPETEERIIDWLAEKVANHKRLRGGVRFINQVPKSASGKILRRVLKAQALEEERSIKAKL